MRIKPFVQHLNFSHMMPTRYNLDISEKLAKLIPDEALTDEEKLAAARKVRCNARARVGAGRVGGVWVLRLRCETRAVAGLSR